MISPDPAPRRRGSRYGSCSSSLFEHDLFGKPVSTFPDHALITRRLLGNRRRRIGRDRDRGTRLQLELPDRDDAIPGLHAFQDLGATIDPVSGLHEAADRRETGLAVIALFLLQ